MKHPCLAASILFLLVSCKDEPTPTWTIRATTAGRVCFDKDGQYSFGVLKLECTEYRSRDSGPALSQDFTHCYIRFPNKALIEKSMPGVSESCEVKDDSKIYAFNAYTGEKAIVTEGEHKVELNCQDSRDLVERSDVIDCQEYLKTRFN